MVNTAEMFPIVGFKGNLVHDCTGRVFKRNGLEIIPGKNGKFKLNKGGKAVFMTYAEIFPYEPSAKERSRLDGIVKERKVRVAAVKAAREAIDNPKKDKKADKTAAKAEKTVDAVVESVVESELILEAAPETDAE